MKKQSAQVWPVAVAVLLFAMGMGAEWLRGTSVTPRFSQQATQTAAPAPADKPAFQGIYTGTLGTQAIVLEVGASAVHTDYDRNIEENEQYPLEGRYFYRRHGVAILLEGAPLPDGGLRFKEYVEQKASGAEWKLNFSGNDASGFFCKCDVGQAPPAGATLAIKLSRVSEGFDPEFTRPDNGKEPPDQAYYDLLLDSPVKTSPEVRVNDQIAYVVQSDPRFKFNMPRLTRFPDKAVMDKINSYLAFQFDDGRLECAAAMQGGHFSGGDRDVHTKVEYLTRDIFSLTMAGSIWLSGTTHPDGFFETLTYDMRKGENFEFSSFFVPPAEITVDKSKEEYDSSGEASNLNWRLARLFVRYSGKDQAQCGENFILQHADTLSWYFSTNGLAVLNDSYMSECGRPVIIPYPALRNLVRKDSPLHYLVETAAEKRKPHSAT